ncbi:MAG: SIS domain-containing protein, partial [Pseudonocardiaceae bacterium]
MMATDSSTQSSRMREAMWGQAEALQRLLEDSTGVESVAERLQSRRVVVVGTGTSWHAAQQGAHLLRMAGLDVSAAQSADAAIDGPLPQEDQVLLALTHTGAKHFTAAALQRARAAGAEIVQISATDVPDCDLATVTRERSSAYTISHLAALMRVAQLAEKLGAPLDQLAAVPAAVQQALES